MRTFTFIVLNACAAVAFIHAPPPRAADERHTDPSMQGTELVEVWVVLSEPALATLPADATEQRAALRQRILRQQDAVMAQLIALGATESGRMQQTSNALAVTLPSAAVSSVKQIDGVTAVRPVSHRNRIH